MTDDTPSKRPRGRPPGTRKREHAVAAAEAVRSRQFNSIREAARHFFPLHIGARDTTPPTVEELRASERFSDFVDYVEEAFRDGELSVRDFGVLGKRSIHRSVQPHERKKRAAANIEEIKAVLASLDDPPPTI
jgi:hypothetical protein